MAGRRWSQDVLNDAKRYGVRVSLHSSDPRDSGSAAVAGPFKVSANEFAVRNGLLQNTRDLVVGASDRSARVRYVALWTGTGNFIKGARLARARQLERGSLIRFRRGKLALRVD